MGQSISIIIPTLNAGNEIAHLIETLYKQTIPFEEIIVVDSESEDDTAIICKSYTRVKLLEIMRKNFDHGGTRDYAIRHAEGEIIVFLTQDAIPADEYFLANLIKPLEVESVAISTGRQIPKPDATLMERLVREYNYPEQSNIRNKEDLQQMGIKTYFTSDVCAAYKKSIYFELGGFDYPLKTNEDMFFAAKAINAGYSIAYAADAKVYHSHNLTLYEQYKRNYIQGYEIEKHKEVLNNVSPNSEGIKLVIYVTKKLLMKGHIIAFVRFGFDCCARYLGSKAGRRYFKNEYNRELVRGK